MTQADFKRFLRKTHNGSLLRAWRQSLVEGRCGLAAGLHSQLKLGDELLAMLKRGLCGNALFLEARKIEQPRNTQISVSGVLIVVPPAGDLRYG